MAMQEMSGFESRPDFSALQSNWLRVIVNPVPQDNDMRRWEVEGGIMFSYTDAEMRILGQGERRIGYDRIIEAIRSDNRSILEKAMDPARPLEDELENLSIKPLRWDGRIVVTLIAGRTPPDPGDWLHSE